MTNPFLLPTDRNCCINFSGGRSSGYMLTKIVEAHGGKLPDNVAVLFSNTGKEHAETYKFIYRIDKHLFDGLSIIWLEYRYNRRAKGRKHKDYRHTFQEVYYGTHSWRGEPFQMLIRTKRMIPNIVTRLCTVELKIRVTEHYLRRHREWSTWSPVIGFRADEAHRADKTGCDTAGELPIYPMIEAGTTKDDVTDYWRRQPFDLGISSLEGNCDKCFAKGKMKIIHLLREDPSSAAWWIEQERWVQEHNQAKRDNKEMAQFSKRYTYEDLLYWSQLPELPMDYDDPLDNAQMGCFCTD